MKNQTLEEKNERRLESLNNFLNHLKETNEDLKDAFITITNKKRLRCFLLVVPTACRYLHGSNEFAYEEMNAFFLGYERKKLNDGLLKQTKKSIETNIDNN